MNRKKLTQKMFCFFLRMPKGIFTLFLAFEEFKNIYFYFADIIKIWIYVINGFYCC